MTTYQDLSPASAAPWTPEEETLLTASVEQIRELPVGKLEALREAYRPTSLAGRTRGDQLRYEALDRELRLRTDLHDLMMKTLPKYRNGSGFGAAMRDQGAAMGPQMDDSSALRLRRMDLDALRLEQRRVRAVAEYCNVTREVRTRLYNYSTDLRRRIERLEKEQA